MKKSIITAFTLLTIVGYGQVEIKSTKGPKSESIGKVSPMGSFLAEINQYDLEGDTSYTIFYRNQKYSAITDIKSVSFNGGKNDLRQVYEIMLSPFKPENKSNKDYVINFKLGKDPAAVYYYKAMGTNYCEFRTEYGYVVLSEKQVNKLFGK